MRRDSKINPREAKELAKRKYMRASNRQMVEMEL